METSRVLALLLAASGKEICGKTMIQKEMYFLSRMLGEDFNYRAYYYGPYSDEVRGGQDELIGLGFVQIRREDFGMEPKGGFDVTRYDFKLTKSGVRLAQWLQKEHPVENEKIKRFVEKLSAVPGGDNYMNLSLAAKVHYILKRSNLPLARDEIKESAKELGWGDIQQKDVEGAVRILEALDLIEN